MVFKGDSLIYQYFRGNDLVFIRFLVVHGADIHEKFNFPCILLIFELFFFGNHPLHYAVLNGNIELLEFLLEQNVDINTTNNNLCHLMT